MTTTAEDTTYMLEALELAARGRYSAPPNPAVGCVLVKFGKKIAAGYHQRAGQPHAEIEALNAAGARARGATAYVTLEPCNHHGRTGPCVAALVAAGVARVVYALDDPNPAVNGGGATALRDAGIAVSRGVCAAQAAQLNTGFVFRMQRGRPRLRIKVAMSLDGGVALANGESQWITGPEARADVQRLRAEACAIVTGIGTVLADDPSLNVRDSRFEMHGRQPQRIVLDSRLRMPATARMLALSGQTRILTCADTVAVSAALRATGAEVEQLPESGGRLDLDAVVARLSELPLNDVLVEAGPLLVGQFIARRCFDELLVYLAPKLLGREALRAFDVASPERLAQVLQVTLFSSEHCGEDVALRFIPEHGDP